MPCGLDSHVSGVGAKLNTGIVRIDIGGVNPSADTEILHYRPSVVIPTVIDHNQLGRKGQIE
jgi:hypothetical protein